MNQQSILTAPQYSAEYPAPPSVHWTVLLAAWAVISLLIECLVPKLLRDLLNSLVIDSWALYICLWMRKLDSESMSAFWCGAFVVVELAFFAVSIQHPRSPGQETTAITLGFASAALWIVMIWIVRAELLKHYNDREPIGLHLRVLRSFAYSFVYFQYHLYSIAQCKKRQAEGLVANQGRTLLP